MGYLNRSQMGFLDGYLPISQNQTFSPGVKEQVHK